MVFTMRSAWLGTVHARCAVQSTDDAACMRQMIKWKQEGMHLPNFGMDLSNPDFVKLAESMGACGHCVSAVRGVLL